MDEYFSHEEIISLKELGLYNDVKKIIDTLKKERNLHYKVKLKKYRTLADFIQGKKQTNNFLKTQKQMENFVELIKQIEPNKVYGIVKNDNNDILFIYEEMIPKKEIEKLLY